MRELIGSGTLFANASVMFGEGASGMTLQVFGDDYPGFLLAILPPGAFLGLGLIIAVKNIIDDRLEQKKKRERKATKQADEDASNVVGGVASE
jgi:electron transport complex protein RnfE